MKNPNITVKLILPALACFALAPQARAVCQEGCELTLFNTFLGADALLNNTTGTGNTATGAGALTFNTTGFNNTATGVSALTFNTHGFNNTAIGSGSLNMNSEGNSNTAVGGALGANTTGGANTAVGVGALADNIAGNNNTVLGFFAGHNLTGDNNIALGFLAGQYPTTGDNNIDIGNQGGADDSGVIRIGTERTHTATHIAGIRHTPLTNGGPVEVGINADGQLGVRPSSARFKEAIKPMDDVSKAIFSLQPVTFRYKNDPAALPQFGLVAEEVAKVNPDLVAPDEEGKPFTVRYDEINTMLLNEFLKEHKRVGELEAMVASLAATVNEQRAQIQKVTDKLGVSRPASQVVVNKQ